MLLTLQGPLFLVLWVQDTILPSQLRCQMDRVSSYPHLLLSPPDSGSVIHALWDMRKRNINMEEQREEGAWRLQGKQSVLYLSASASGL